MCCVAKLVAIYIATKYISGCKKEHGIATKYFCCCMFSSVVAINVAILLHNGAYGRITENEKKKPTWSLNRGLKEQT